MTSYRLQRVAEQIQQEISALVVKGLKDPRIGFVTITAVEVSADLSHAWVYVTSPGTKDEQARSLEGLASAAGYIRRTLGKRLHLKMVPEFSFKLDESFERGQRIEKLIREVREKEGWDDPTRLRGSPEEVVETFAEAKDILVTCHTNPDGDAIASLLGAYLLLKKLGKTPLPYCKDPVPYNFEFLPAANEISDSVPDGKKFDCTVVVDCSELARCGPLPEKENLGTLVSIDHHLTAEPLGDRYYLNPSAAAVGQMLLDVADAAGAELDKDIATCLYTSIVSDTGSFRYSNTTPEAMRAAARLLEHGVDPWQVAFNLYESQPLQRIKLLGMVLSTLELFADGRIAVVTVTRQMLESCGATVDMLDGVINYPRGIRGVEVAIQVREQDDEYKFSFRSAGRVDVARIAAEFGGGGHRNAAGCTLDPPLGQALQRVIQRLELALTETDEPEK
ncbi:MAG: 30S ribosome-binding factor RbfA [Deltaproteobacteria bacterium]|nr:MAG: 30S ribosome-binding factor RbfA [Deltaproteobacteria bacterium]